MRNYWWVYCKQCKKDFVKDDIEIKDVVCYTSLQDKSMYSGKIGNAVTYFCSKKCFKEYI